MNPRLYIILLGCLEFHSSSGQERAAHWYFGRWAGLDFTCEPPQARRSGMYYTQESSASISDTIGNLLFYTDGDSVFDRTHHMMVNGFGLGDNSIDWGSATQGSLIVPKPGSQDDYYVFNVDCAEDMLSDGLRYSEIDMSLNGGLGEVTSKFNLLWAPVTEKLTAVHHANGEDIWVLAHEHGTDAFLAYLVTAMGISSPVISHTGFVQMLSTYPECMARGYMKFSPNGQRLVVLSYSQCHTYVFSPQIFGFDDSTGTVSLDYTVLDPDSIMYYGAAFSPNSELLYMTGRWGTARLDQFDATAVNAVDFMASQQVLLDSTDGALIGLQNGPDGRIYISTGSAWISTIDEPNSVGPGCDFEYKNIELFGCTQALLGLPNFVESYFRDSMTATFCPVDSIHADFVFPVGVICIGDTVQFTDQSTCYPENVGRWSWAFDDPGSGPGNSSTTEDPVHVFASAGTYDVQLIAGIEMLPFTCKSDTITATVNVISCTEGIAPSEGAGYNIHTLEDLLQFTEQRSTTLMISDVMGRVLVYGDRSAVLDWYGQRSVHKLPAVVVYQLEGPDIGLRGRLLLGVNK